MILSGFRLVQTALAGVRRGAAPQIDVWRLVIAASAVVPPPGSSVCQSASVVVVVGDVVVFYTTHSHTTLHYGSEDGGAVGLDKAP